MHLVRLAGLGQAAFPATRVEGWMQGRWLFPAVVLLALVGQAACTKGRPGTTRQATDTTSGAEAAAGGAPGAAPDGRSYLITNPRFDPLPGARVLYGELHGAAYEIEVPDAWNGALVLYDHGFTGNDPVLFVQPPTLRAYFVQKGFAWAASSYATSGYNPDQGLADTLALRGLFVAQVGAPRRLYIDGTSMGGHVVVSALEQHPELFSGGFSECGVVAGVEELDYLVSYAALAGYATNIDLPITDPAAYRDAAHARVLPALGASDQPTAAGRRFEALVSSLTGGPRPWRHRGFLDRRSANFDLLVTGDSTRRTLAERSATNAGAHYAAPADSGVDVTDLNARIERVSADPAARNALAHSGFVPRTGKLQAPLLTLHTTGDHFVPISLEQSYRHAVDAAGAGSFLVQRAIRRPDHCQFTQAELQAGFSDLVNWVENGVQPAGDDLGQSDLSDVGTRFTTPLLPGDPGEE